MLKHTLPFLPPRSSCLLLQEISDGQHRTERERDRGYGKPAVKNPQVPRFIATQSVRYGSQLLWPRGRKVRNPVPRSRWGRGLGANMAAAAPPPVTMATGRAPRGVVGGARGGAQLGPFPRAAINNPRPLIGRREKMVAPRDTPS